MIAPRRWGGIGYWMINYAPAWEAASKQIALLFGEFAGTVGARVLGFNFRGEMLRLAGPKKVLPAPLLLAPAPLLRRLAGSFDVNHLFASAGERFILPKIKGPRLMLSIAKPSTPEAFERNAVYLRDLRYVVVESERHRELLRAGGVHGDAIKLIYPGEPRRAFVRASGPFTILFATSPFGKGELTERGLPLIVEVAKELPQVRFVLVWREHNFAELRRLLDGSAVQNVEVRNTFIRDMGAVYDAVHATILPGLHPDSLKPCPQSLLDSLGHGKPVLVSRPTHTSGVIERSGAGVVFDPHHEGLREAILHLMEHYDRYQANCHPTVEATFSPQVFVERYRRLYESILRA